MDDMAQTMATGGCAGMVWRPLAAMGLAIAMALPAAAREVQFEPVPDWVTQVSAPVQVQAAPGTTSGGVQYLLVDRQTRLEANDRVAYVHFAMRPLSGDGVEEAAHVEIPFDPSYQTLALHSIKVHRGGKQYSRLNPAGVRVLQREKNLEARIYDGRKTANVLLDDVRIGDVVEYDYTIRGINPAYHGRHFGTYDLQWKVPLQSLHERLLVSEGRDLHITSRNTTLQPEVAHRGGWVEYVWRASALPAIEVDNDGPAWYDPYPIVQWSEYTDWAAVATWALPLYRAAPDQGPALQAQIDVIARENPRPAERLLAALHFVQREVRYLGIEVGVGSLTPRAPRTVLDRRYGDCKDKALLTVWILQALGIDARVALVNTQLGRGIEHYLPSPGIFDHVVVRARVGGHDYWLDPTRPVQKGTLANLSQPDFGRALVVDETTTGLQSMLGERDVVRRQDIHTVLDATGGRGKPVTMEVTTVYHGDSAEGIRQDIASNSREVLQRNYLNFYAGFYPEVTVDQPFTVSDDEVQNQVTVTEHYRLADLWKRSDNHKRFEALIYSPEIDSRLRTPDRTLRKGPLALRYPSVIVSATEIRLHKDWPLAIKPGSIEDPAFKFSYETSHDGSVVKMTERLETLADNVPADRIAAYVVQVQRARDSLGIRLFLPDVSDRTAALLNWPVALLGVCMLGGALWLARRLYRFDPPPVFVAPGLAPRGIRGWLLLPALGVIASPLRIGNDLLDTLPTYGTDVWARLTIPGGEHYSAGWAPVLLLTLAANIFLLIFALTLVVLFFRKRSSLPRAYIAFLCAWLAISLLDQIGALFLPGAGAESSHGWTTLVRNAVSSAIWVRYFMVSRRVAATFVERLHQPSEVKASVHGGLAESGGSLTPVP